MRFVPTLAAALATGALATAAFAATPQMNAADSINARQTHYKEIGRAWKAINEQLKSPAPDKAVISKNADILALYAPQIGGWFPKGSGSGAGLKTAAKDEIWSDPQGFLVQVKQFDERTKKFQATAHSGVIADIKDFAPQVGAACKSCHERFRVKDHD